MLPQTKTVAARAIIVATGQSVTPEIIREVSDLICISFENSDEIRSLMEGNRQTEV